jgi:hypothetical protein
MRIVTIQSIAQWTGAIDKQDFLDLPPTLDLASEEAAWFASGGDSSGKSFAEYLISKGATLLTPEVWTINYQ